MQGGVRAGNELLLLWEGGGGGQSVNDRYLNLPGFLVFLLAKRKLEAFARVPAFRLASLHGGKHGGTDPQPEFTRNWLVRPLPTPNPALGVQMPGVCQRHQVKSVILLEFRII